MSRLFSTSTSTSEQSKISRSIKPDLERASHFSTLVFFFDMLDLLRMSTSTEEQSRMLRESKPAFERDLHWLTKVALEL